jgi:hypothetical protein
MEDRRKDDAYIKELLITLQKDHDQITRLVEVIAIHVNNFSEHRSEFKQHLVDDDTNFKRIDKTIYTATGIVVSVLFLLEVVLKVFK